MTAKLLKSTLIILLMSTTSFAATTNEQLDACDRALNAKIQEASLCGLGVQLRTNEIDRVSKENAALRERGSAWYENPAVWAALGVIAGTYIGSRATR